MKCLAPWHSILVRFNGDIVPDGVYTNRYGNIITQELPDIFNSIVSSNTKDSIRSGVLPNECSQCVKKENVVGHSRRLFFRDILNPLVENNSYDYSSNFHDIRFLEFNMSNICNLKCRMCNGISSSAWVKEEIKLNKLNSKYQRPVTHPEFGYRNLSDEIVDRLFSYPDYFKNLSYVSIKGGEPYMEPANKKILRRLIELGINQNITLDVTTNGTIVDKEFHELAKQFKHTKWTVSVEATGKLYEYIRGGKNFTFEQLQDNLNEYRIFDRIIIAVTVMTYNVSQLYTIQDWYDSVKKDNFTIYYNNVVATPNYLNPRLLPNDILQLGKNLNNIETINYTQDPALAYLLPTFVDFTRDLDNIRGTDVLEVCPELRSLFA
jgi:MoaA/NifB/PqqE/SkfB family radical SAM enzyme